MAASASLWSAADSQATLLNTGATLTSGSVAVSSAATPDNSTASTARRQFGMLELSVTYGSAPAAGDYVTVYLVPAPDGTNYGDTTDPIANTCIVANIPVRAVNTAQLIQAPIQLPGPFKFKTCLKNNAGQTMNSGWTLKINTFSNEQQ